MDEKIEAFREEVLQWRGTRRKGARPYTTEMKAKALQLAWLGSCRRFAPTGRPDEPVRLRPDCHWSLGERRR